MTKLFLVRLFLLIASPAACVFATSRALPTAKEYYSADRTLRFEVIPVTGITINDALALERGDYFQLTATFPDRAPGSLRPIGRLSRLIEGRYEVMWQRVLENNLSPLVIEIVNSEIGPYVISFNDYFLFEGSSAAVVIYASTGRTIRRYALSELIAENELRDIFARMGTVNLLQHHTVSEKLITIQLDASAVEINIETGALKKVNVRTQPQHGEEQRAKP